MRFFLAIILAALMVQGCATPPLHQAASKGDMATVKTLLEHGAKVDQTDNLGRTPLYFAAQRGAKEVVQLLLAKGADPTHRSLLSPGNTPMHMAAQNGHDGILEMFLAANITPDLFNRNRQTPLMLAAWARLPETVGLLLSRKANPMLQDVNGWTVLHADWRPKPNGPDYEDTMEMLISDNAPVNVAARNPAGYTPLMSACQVGSVKVAKMLLDAGAEVNLQDDVGETAYFIAANAHNEPLMSLLSERGAVTKASFYKEPPKIPVIIDEADQ